MSPYAASLFFIIPPESGTSFAIQLEEKEYETHSRTEHPFVLKLICSTLPSCPHFRWRLWLVNTCRICLHEQTAVWVISFSVPPYGLFQYNPCMKVLHQRTYIFFFDFVCFPGRPYLMRLPIAVWGDSILLRNSLSMSHARENTFRRSNTVKGYQLLARPPRQHHQLQALPLALLLLAG